MGRIPAQVELIEPALPSKLFRRLHRRILGLKGERRRTTYQTTFWFDLEREPSAIPEEAAIHLIGRIRLLRGRRVRGVEWWLSRMKTSDVQVDFHRDRDERLALQGGPIRHPLVSSVLFLNRVRGGCLAVSELPPSSDNPSMAPARPDFTLVGPRPNRFAAFDGRLTHGVLDVHNQVPNRPTTGSSRWRIAVVFNWWSARPHQVPAFEESDAYRTLKV